MRSHSPWALTRKQIDDEARRIRDDVSARHLVAFDQEFDTNTCSELVSASALRGHLSGFPAANPARVLAFSLFVTRTAVRHIVQTCEDPFYLAFVAPRVAELGMYAFVDPDNAMRPLTYLGASKEIGYFFTPPEVAQFLAERAAGSRPTLGHVLDPAAGCGSLLSAVLLSAKQRSQAIERLTAIERDSFTATLLEPILSRVGELLDMRVSIEVIAGDAFALLGEAAHVPVLAADTIVMNPPYGRIKFLRSSLTNAETRVGTARHSLDEQARARQQATSAEARRLKDLSESLGLGRGSQDYQRLFTALALRHLAPGGRMAMITPSGWLGDKEATALRRSILSQRTLEEIEIFPEDSGLFATVNQPTAISVFSRTPGTRGFRVTHVAGRTLERTDAYDVLYADLERHDPAALRIPRLPSTMYHIFEHLQTFPRIRNVAGLRNARGELDQTAGKPFLTNEPTSIRFVRGEHIERYVLRAPEYSDQVSYVNTNMFSPQVIGAAKYADTLKPRVAGRQCSYMKKERRLSFTRVPAGVVLGNSCNYLCAEDDNALPDGYLDALLALLNSAVIEWYFRVYSSNNHVANYEIDDFPTCLANSAIFDELRKAGEFLTSAYTPLGGLKRALPIEDVVDALVAYGFGLTPAQTLAVLSTIDSPRAARVSHMVSVLHRDGIPSAIDGQGWYQHLPPALSQLDREVIRHVPQGGNWQNIPTSVPSKRLEQIREMSAARGVVRTTYYGRLRPDQPAYTIATYYNRPGNGTNIHPWENRTLSNREAARFQSFPDYYVFLGTDTSMRKQIGNAVPPLLAYAVGAHLRGLTERNTCVDLFAGAGGLSLGLELAGWEIGASLDFDHHAIATYEFNRPCERHPDPASNRTLLLESDLYDAEQRKQAIQSIRTKLGGMPPALLVGGPPCQGFSHAGFRQATDSRNDLAMVFMTFVEQLEPELVVLENVEGLLTYKGGQVVRDLLLTLRELGYETGTSPWCLNAEQYGVPQMRRRVFLIGSRNGRRVTPPNPAFARCAGRRESRQTAELFAPQPYPFTAAETLIDLAPLSPREHASMGSRAVRTAYAHWLKGALTTEHLLSTRDVALSKLSLDADDVATSCMEDSA